MSMWLHCAIQRHRKGVSGRVSIELEAYQVVIYNQKDSYCEVASKADGGGV